MLKRTRLSLAISAAFGAGLVADYSAVLAQQQLDRVEITGSSIRRVDAETALPVTVIKVEDLIKQGVTTAEQAVQRIAANQSNFGTSRAIGATTGGKARSRSARPERRQPAPTRTRRWCCSTAGASSIIRSMPRRST